MPQCDGRMLYSNSSCPLSVPQAAAAAARRFFSVNCQAATQPVDVRYSCPCEHLQCPSCRAFAGRWRCSLCSWRLQGQYSTRTQTVRPPCSAALPATTEMRQRPRPGGRLQPSRVSQRHIEAAGAAQVTPPCHSAWVGAVRVACGVAWWVLQAAMAALAIAHVCMWWEGDLYDPPGRLCIQSTAGDRSWRPFAEVDRAAGVAAVYQVSDVLERTRSDFQVRSALLHAAGMPHNN